MNSKLFKAFMVMNDETIASLADYLGLTDQSVCNKINENGTEFKLGEIIRIKVRWNLSADMVDQIFFNLGVSKLDTKE